MQIIRGTEMSVLEQDAYTGIEILEVMTEAKNYNLYLHSLIGSHIRAGIKVVDFGAGTGTFAFPLAQRGVDIICVEPDATLAAVLRSTGASVATTLDEIAKESIDFIYTLNVLEHIGDDAAALRALAQKLKPAGTLLIYVPAFKLLYSSFDRRIGHLRRYDRKTLSVVVEAAGLRVAEVRYADSAGFLAALLYRVLKGKDGSVSRGAVALYDRFIFPLSTVLDMALSRWVGKNLILVSNK
jgi:SAM-dependent methyltransferase